MTESCTMKTLILTVPAIAFLAACGGSSAGSAGGGVSNAFNTPQGAIDALEDFNNRNGELQPTPVAAIPTAGSASYDGVLTVARFVERFPGDPDPLVLDPLIGELEVDVDFAANTVTGGADNFFSPTNAVEGSLTLSEGEILRDPAAVLVGAEVSGTLPVRGAQQGVTGGLLGVFTDTNAQSLSGIVALESVDGTELLGAISADD